jgi:ATP-dependent protease ClpP protease subunit
METKKSIFPFSITAEKKGKRAEVRIIGVIGWETNSESFRRDVDALVSDGITEAHIYINSPGGSCFDANEIVNILSKFKGSVTGEGGALVASAGTYIALHCREFSMPSNGQFMIHKPKGSIISGDVQDIENYLKSLRNIDSLYYESYKAVASDLTELDKRWNGGDWWMTATEAKEMGFITEVMPRVKIDKETAALATVFGCPVGLRSEVDSVNKKTKKRMELVALALGLEPTATEAEITAKINEMKGQSARASALEKSLQDVRDAQLTATVDAAVGKKFTADKRQHFIDLGKSVGVDALKATLDAIPEVVKPTDVIGAAKASGEKTEKKFEDLTGEERIALREGDSKEYSRLYKAHYGFAPIF